jgi:23S rRNA pseudouridine1911/1915/1917 synthase
MARRSPAAPAHLPDPLVADAIETVEDIGDDDWSEAAQAAPGPAPATVPERRDFKVDDASHGQRIDVFLAAQVPEYSRSHLKTLIEDGCVEVDGQAVASASRKVLVRQKVCVSLKPTAQSLAFVPEKMDLAVVYEDEHLMVINKPAGLVVHPAAGNWTGTLMNGLLAHHKSAVDLPRAGIVHRLDKDTSGLMVVGKTLAAVTALSRAIAAREVSRKYRALVHGEVPERFTVEAAIGRDPTTRVRMAVVASGKPARTDVERLIVGEFEVEGAGASRLGNRSPKPRAISGVLCTLHTGRTHQIRVHLTSRKHPLLADALYGGAPALGMARQALHAARLAFAHPMTGAALAFEAELPADMAAAWVLLEGLSVA